jgi:hypothetical protein
VKDGWVGTKVPGGIVVMDEDMNEGLLSVISNSFSRGKRYTKLAYKKVLEKNMNMNVRICVVFMGTLLLLFFYDERHNNNNGCLLRGCALPRITFNRNLLDNELLGISWIQTSRKVL